MAKNSKPQKSLLSESAVRRMMKLAEIPALAENFFNEKQGYRDEEDESLGMRTGPERDKEESEKDRREDSYGKWGKRDKEDRGTSLEEDDDAEKLDATEDELGAEDDVADEEADELDAEAAEGEAEITPEAAEAIIDLAAQLEASGAVEAEEAEEEVVDAVDDMEAVEVEEIEEDIFEAALRGLGVEVINDTSSRLEEVKRQVYKKVIQRLLKESKASKTPTPRKRKIRRRRK